MLWSIYTVRAGWLHSIIVLLTNIYLTKLSIRYCLQFLWFKLIIHFIMKQQKTKTNIWPIDLMVNFLIILKSFVNILKYWNFGYCFDIYCDLILSKLPTHRYCMFFLMEKTDMRYKKDIFFLQKAVTKTWNFPKKIKSFDRKYQIFLSSSRTVINQHEHVVLIPPFLCGPFRQLRLAFEKYLPCYRKFNVICNCLTLMNIKGSHLWPIKNACGIVVVDHV